MGLSHLIKFSIPVMTIIYPPCIALVLLSFIGKLWRCESRVMIPVMLVTSLVGVLDAVKGSSLVYLLPAWIEHLPGANQGLAWLLPMLVTLVIAGILDRLIAVPKKASDA